METVIGAIKQDLARPDDGAQSLALACIANMGGQSLAGPLADGVGVNLKRSRDTFTCQVLRAHLCVQHTCAC